MSTFLEYIAIFSDKQAMEKKKGGLDVSSVLAAPTILKLIAFPISTMSTITEDASTIVHENVGRALSEREIRDLMLNYMYRTEANRLQDIQTKFLGEKLLKTMLKDKKKKSED